MSLDDNTLDWVLNKIKSRINRWNKALEELNGMDVSDMNPQAVEDVRIILTLKRDAMVELKEEIEKTS